MKTIQKGDEIRRVENDKAEEMIKQGWKFIPKSVWKQKVRPAVKKVEPKVEKSPDKGKSKYKAKKEKYDLMNQK